MTSRLEKLVIRDETGQVMLHIVDPHAETVMANEKTVDDARGVLEVHRQLRPEMAVQQIMRTIMQRTIKLL